MKLCMYCLEELLDQDMICPKCHNKNLICNEKLKQIKWELKNSSQIKKEKMLLNPTYMCVNTYMIRKQQRDENYPEIVKYYENTTMNINPSYNEMQSSTNSIPKCPTCGSTNVQPIGAGEKVISGALFGLFSTKIRKSYKCNNCKYMW